MKRPSLYIAGILLIALAAGIFIRRNSPTPSRPAPHVPSPTYAEKQSKETNPFGSADREAQKILDLVEQIGVERIERWSADRVARELGVTESPADRRRVLAQLRDERYDREAVIRVLRVALRDKDTALRVLAADLLYQWGSAEGKETLLGIISATRSIPAAELIHVIRAAEVLSDNRERIPYESLVALYEETRDGGVLRVMAAQKDERYLPYLLERARLDPNGMVRLVGDLGVPGGYPVAKQVFEGTRNMEVRVDAAWAMYRCGADESALSFLIEQAQSVLEQRSGVDSFASNLALRHLALIPTHRALPVLQTALHSRDSASSNTALASLYFVQKDVHYVDRFIEEYLRHASAQVQQHGEAVVKPIWSVDPNLVWRIVGERNDPKLTSLAFAANKERSDQFLGRTKGIRSPSTWLKVYLRELPSSP